MRIVAWNFQQVHVTYNTQYTINIYFSAKSGEHVCTTGNQPELTVDDVVTKSPDVPLTTQEDKLATSLVRRKMAQGSEDGLIHFKTGGQVISNYKLYKKIMAM